MKIFFFLLFISGCFFAFGSNYYINPSAESIEEKGTIRNPWKSVNPLNENMSFLKGGDTIFFKRGELFQGRIIIKCSGRQKALIVFMPYGEGLAKPLLLYKPGDPDQPAEAAAIWVYKGNHIVINGFEISDEHMDPFDHNIRARTKIGIAIDESNFITIKNCDISLVGIGVNMVGDNNLIDSCTMKNLRMVRNTEGGTDDYGANGVVLAGSNNIISHCDFRDCWANSFDFIFDGGAVEMAGPNCSKNKIIGNTATHCNGFMELGSTDGGVIGNNYIGDNTVFNCGDLLYINNDGPYAVEVQHLELVNNLFIQTFEQLTKPKSMIAMAKTSEKKKIILLRNNIFWLPMQIDVAKDTQLSGGQLIHTNNIYYMRGGQLNFTIDKSEIILDSSSQVFKHLGNPNLFKNSDLLPFSRLIKFWYLII